MIEGVLFDKDGVLIDSEAMYFAAMRETFRKYGVDITEAVFLKNWIVNPSISSRGTIDEYGLQSQRDENNIMIRTKNIRRRAKRIEI
jgi:beta-phosphoglucomutase-like phosphatase (HAD superfamily)